MISDGVTVMTVIMMMMMMMADRPMSRSPCSQYAVKFIVGIRKASYIAYHKVFGY